MRWSKRDKDEEREREREKGTRMTYSSPGDISIFKHGKTRGPAGPQISLYSKQDAQASYTLKIKKLG